MKNLYSLILILSFLLLSFQVCFSQSTKEKQKQTLSDSLIVNINNKAIDSISDKQQTIALGYTIKKEQIEDSPELDINRVITNKISGLEVKQVNGLSGSANRIWIRGISSIYGDNNALFVVDGIPMTNTTNEFKQWMKDLSTPTRSLDINPNNIESIEVLKSLAETNLYGSEGRNGVILINTKTGSIKNSDLNLLSNPQIQFSFSKFSIDIASLPDYQDKFGQGWDQGFGWYYANWGPGFYKDGLGGWGNNFYYDENGNIHSPFDENGTLPHPYSTSSWLLQHYPDYQAQFIGQRYEWEPRNNARDFFETGSNINASFNILTKSKNDKHTFGFDLNYIDEVGFTPGNSLSKYNISIGNSSRVLKNLRFTTSLNVSRTDLDTPIHYPSHYSSIYPFSFTLLESVFTTPRSIDIFELPYELPDGGSIYYRGDNAIEHPLWTLNNTGFSQLTNRLYGDISLQYDLNDNFRLLYNTSLDTFIEANINYRNKGGVSDSNLLRNGFYDTWDNRRRIIKHNVKFDYNKTHKDITYDFLIGAENKTNNHSQKVKQSDEQIVYGDFIHSNFLNHSEIDTIKKKNIFGLFGHFSFDYKDYLFIDISGRNDFVSDEVNNSVFMPAVDVSFVPTQYFDKLKKNKILNYLKLRSAYGTSANYDKASLSSTINSSSYDGNANLLPEFLSEIEYGIESMLFDFVSFNLRLYNRRAKNLLIRHFEYINYENFLTIKNVGEVKFNGIELDLGLDIFKNRNGFRYRSTINFTKTNSEVIDIGEDDDIILYSGNSSYGNGARVGYPLGAFFGNRIARNEDGIPIIDSNGNYMAETIDEEGLQPFIGNPNPDFIVNYSNSLSYKNFSFSFLINHRVGGNIDSYTISSLLGRGLTADTVDRLGTFVLSGVSHETGEVNTIQITNSDFYFGNMYAGPSHEISIFDASIIRLQEASLSYNLSNKSLEKAFIKNIKFKVIGYNLWFNAYNTPKGINYDPNVSNSTYGNNNGFDFFSGPTNKKIGFSLEFTF